MQRPAGVARPLMREYFWNDLLSPEHRLGGSLTIDEGENGMDSVARSRRRRLRALNRWAQAAGWNVRASGMAARRIGAFWDDAKEFRKRGGLIDEYWPRLHESSEAGLASGHYFWQDLLVARRVAQTNPTRHVDVGSRIDGFVAHLLAFRPVEVVDIRESPGPIPGLTFIRSDGRTLDGIGDRTVISLSSLHALEHFGLGRYGDDIDPEGHHRGLRAAQRVLAVTGRLWVSFPVGKPKVQFNAQRVLDPVEPIAVLDELTLVDFTAIPGDGPPVTSADPADFRNDDMWCGLYEFIRAPLDVKK
ncbi:MAG: DUF268 domain-containing protein [Candidatus Nanopelagicales bacterium]